MTHGAGVLAAFLALCGPAAAQVAILQIQVISGEGAVHAPGSRDSRGVAVEVTDETGRPVEGAAVSFHLPDQGPSGTFINGLHTEVAITDGRGRAAVHAIEFNHAEGRLEIRIVASKEQARAGTVSFQYITGDSPGAATAKIKGRWHPKKKWLIVAAVVGAGAAGGALAAAHSATAAATAESTVTLTIGPPSITVGKP